MKWARPSVAENFQLESCTFASVLFVLMRALIFQLEARNSFVHEVLFNTL